MDGYTYMIERNKLMIQLGRKSDPASPSAPQPAHAEVSDHAQMREGLMDLYAGLEGCGRAEEQHSE